jgi:hypothetical protein
MLEAESSPVLEPGDAEAPMVQRRLVTTLTRAVLFGAGLFVFILALEALKRGAGAYGSLASGLFRVESPAGALGLGWLLAYLFLSGSPVAALAVSLFAAGSLDAPQTLMMITGSRLGASLVVLVTGLIYAARGRHSTEGVAVGVLSLLTTAVIYLPAMALAYMLVAGEFITMPAIGAADIAARPDHRSDCRGDDRAYFIPGPDRHGHAPPDGRVYPARPGPANHPSRESRPGARRTAL